MRNYKKNNRLDVKYPLLYEWLDDSDFKDPSKLFKLYDIQENIVKTIPNVKYKYLFNYLHDSSIKLLKDKKDVILTCNNFILEEPLSHLSFIKLIFKDIDKFSINRLNKNNKLLPVSMKILELNLEFLMSDLRNYDKNNVNIGILISSMGDPKKRYNYILEIKCKDIEIEDGETLHK